MRVWNGIKAAQVTILCGVMSLQGPCVVIWRPPGCTEATTLSTNQAVGCLFFRTIVLKLLFIFSLHDSCDPRRGRGLHLQIALPEDGPAVMIHCREHHHPFVTSHPVCCSSLYKGHSDSLQSICLRMQRQVCVRVPTSCSAAVSTYPSRPTPLVSTMHLEAILTS
jgi:hypothetical protein